MLMQVAQEAGAGHCAATQRVPVCADADRARGSAPKAHGRTAQARHRAAVRRVPGSERPLSNDGATAMGIRMSTFATCRFRVRVSVEAFNRLSCPHSADTALNSYNPPH